MPPNMDKKSTLKILFSRILFSVDQKLLIKALTGVKISGFNSKVQKRDSYLISTKLVKK